MAMTTEQAKKWLDEAEQKPPADVDWRELQDAITALKSVVSGGSLDKPYLDRALALAHRKAQPHLMNARAGDTSLETMAQLAEAAKVVRASANVRGQLDPIDQAFIAEVGEVASTTQSARPGRERAAPPQAEASRITQSVEAYKAGRPRERFYQAAAKAGISPWQVEMEWGTLEAQAAASGMSLQEAIEAKIAEFEVMAAEARGPAIGPAGDLPFGFEAVRTEPTQAATGGLQEVRDREGRQGPNRSVTVPTRYFDGDELRPAGYPEEVRAELQQAMVDAGLLSADEFYPGWWDEKSIKAYRQALGYANAWGMSVDEAISQLAKSLPAALEDGTASQSGLDAVANTYVKPDYATLAQTVKRTFRGRLGREPSEKELAELASALGGYYRAQFDADFSTTQAQRAANEAAEEAGADAEMVIGQGVDPVSRFYELFDQRYESEEQRLEGIEDVRNNTSNVFSSLTRMQSLIGG